MIVNLLLALLLLISSPFSGPPPVKLSLDRTTAFAPVHVQAKITIPPNEANRQACLTWDSFDNEAGQHCFPLNGKDFPSTILYTFPIHDPGEYAVIVYLVQTTQIINSNRIPLLVN